MAPHNQPTLGRVVPAHVVVPLRLPTGLPCPIREQRSSSRYQVMAACNAFASSQGARILTSHKVLPQSTGWLCSYL